MTDLSTVKNRDGLKARQEPYWQKLAIGQFLGYRPSKVGAGGNWIARLYDPEERKQRFHALGDFGHLPPNERFGAASADARAWFKLVSGGVAHDIVTVRDACEAYASTRPDAAKRFPRYVYNDPIASVKLQRLTTRQVLDWRRRLESLPAKVSRSTKGEQVTRKRAAATVNRDMVPFRAALNAACVPHAIWKTALTPEQTHGRRDLYLDLEQRRLLVANVAAEIAPFVRGLCILPLRPGALAKLTAIDFDPRQQTLHVLKDKANGGRRIPLPDDLAAFLASQCDGKAAATHIFTRANGLQWDKDSWKRPVKAAAITAGLPVATTAYTLRHSIITDLVQTNLIPLLAVAQLSGTSVKMIEKHYGHLRQEQAAKALGTLML